MFSSNTFYMMRLKVLLSCIESFTDSSTTFEQSTVEYLTKMNSSFIFNFFFLFHTYHMLSPSIFEYLTCELRMTARHEYQLRLYTLVLKSASQQIIWK